MLLRIIYHSLEFTGEMQWLSDNPREKATGTCSMGCTRLDSQAQAGGLSKLLWRVFNVPSTRLCTQAMQGTQHTKSHFHRTYR